MALFWSESFLIGHKEIDSQHQTILLIISTIENDIRTNSFLDTIKTHIALLFKTTEEHFASEEALQISLGSPHLKTHQQEHQNLKKELEEIIGGLNSIILETGECKQGKYQEIFDCFDKLFTDHILMDCLEIKKLFSNPA